MQDRVSCNSYLFLEHVCATLRTSTGQRHSGLWPKSGFQNQTKRTPIYNDAIRHGSWHCRTPAWLGVFLCSRAGSREKPPLGNKSMHHLPSKTCAIPPAAPANRSFSVRCKLPGSTSRSAISQPFRFPFEMTPSLCNRTISVSVNDMLRTQGDIQIGGASNLCSMYCNWKN